MSPHAPAPIGPPPRAAVRRAAVRRAHCRGFTLVELLVVITIIAILASLITVVAFSAFGSSKETLLAVEVRSIEDALEQYKQARGDYPPDFTATDPNRTLVLRHLTNSYQRLNLAERQMIANSLTTGANVTIDALNRKLEDLDQAEAIVFWLSELYDHNQFPVTGYNGQAKKKVFFNFPTDRLFDVDNDGWKEYYPSARPDEAPYVYFHHLTYPQAGYVYPNRGVAIAYLSDEPDATMAPFNYRFANPQKFQILCPGLDGKFNARTSPVPPANYPGFPSGRNYDINNGELDNITNFSGGVLEDKIDR